MKVAIEVPQLDFAEMKSTHRILRKLNPQSILLSYHLWLYFVTFFVILPIIGKDLKFSIYRSSSWTKEALQKKILLNNVVAVNEAENFLTALEQTGNPVRLTGTKMVIAIVTVRRFSESKPLGYLTRVVASFYQILEKDAAKSDKYLFICNTHAGPGHHEEAEKLSWLYPVIERFPNGSAEASIMNPFEKEKQDYVFCMEQALHFSPEFVLMVEDDANPRDELFGVIENQISFLDVKDHNSGPVNWSYLKLYYPERWQGYSFEWQNICELFAVSAVGATCFVLCKARFCEVRRRFILERDYWRTPVFGGFYFLLVALAIGRQHLLELKRISVFGYSLTAAQECCSPCILFPVKSVSHIVRYLKTVACSHQMPLDLALDKFTHVQEMPGYAVEPNVFQHIGFVSTMKGLSNHPEEFLT